MIPTQQTFQLHEFIAGSRLSIYPNAGHGGIFQYADLFVAQALSFLSGEYDTAEKGHTK